MKEEDEEDKSEYLTGLEVRDELNEISALTDCLHLILEEKGCSYKSYPSNPHLTLLYKIKEMVDSLEERIKTGYES